MLMMLRSSEVLNQMMVSLTKMRGKLRGRSLILLELDSCSSFM